MKIYVNETLEKIDKEQDKDKKMALLKEWGIQHPYNMILSLAFDDRVNVDVPEGMPPYKRDEATNQDLFPSFLGKEIKRLGSILKGRNNVARLQREHIFIQA